jgi:hypothetical protein
MQPSARNLRFRSACDCVGRDFLASFVRDFGSPRQRPTSMQELVLNRPRVLLQTRSASETGHRLSERPVRSRNGKDLPGYWAVLFLRAVVQHPAGFVLASPLLLFEKIHGENAIAFRKFRSLGIRKVIDFEATYPRPTRSCAYASPVSLPRPSPGSLPARAGSPLAGRVSHPLDDVRNFMESFASPPIPIDQQSLVALNRLSARARSTD